MRFKLTIEYAGTRYSGWQIQKNARTVQGEIDRAVRDVTGQREFELYGSGRTDAGVHALAQVAHLDIQTTLPAEALRRRLNEELPSDINILEIEQVRHRFHARHDAASRSYVYNVSRRRTAFAKPYVWWVKDDLDLPRMRAIAERFVGLHDFRSFSDDDPTEKSTSVRVQSLELVEEDDLIVFRIRGSHFIWKMVRRLVGVIIEVGRGGMTVDEAAALFTQGSEIAARLTAPAAGLFLEQVFYEGASGRQPTRSPAGRYGRSLAGGTRPLRRR
jgi:tRNA pseudouridine38-40 synthase